MTSLNLSHPSHSLRSWAQTLTQGPGTVHLQSTWGRGIITFSLDVGAAVAHTVVVGALTQLVSQVTKGSTQPPVATSSNHSEEGPGAAEKAF